MCDCPHHPLGCYGHPTACKCAATVERRPHKTMTLEEYAAMPIIGWHEVCRDVDGFGGVGVRFLSDR